MPSYLITILRIPLCSPDIANHHLLSSLLFFLLGIRAPVRSWDGHIDREKLFLCSWVPSTISSAWYVGPIAVAYYGSRLVDRVMEKGCLGEGYLDQ